MVLDAASLENPHRTVPRIVNRLIAAKVLSGALILSMLGTIAILGFNEGEPFKQKVLLHLQREEDRSYQHLEVITPQGHSIQRFDLFGASSKWPRFLHSPPKDLGESQFTSQEIDEKRGGLFFYDNWERRSQLSSPASEASDVQRNLILLIDRSGTMKREGGSGDLNALARVFKHTQSWRSKDRRPWRCFSFSSRLEDHGIWQIDSPPPQGLFGESRGTTALIHALSNLTSKLEGPSDIVVISDGETDTRDFDSLNRTFESLLRSGHRASLLSPDFEPVDKWKKSYASGVIMNSWPIEKPAKSISTLYEHTESQTLWGKRRHVWLEEHHVVLLRDEEGRALISMEAGQAPLRFHVIAELKSKPDDLKTWLLRRFGSRPTLILDGERVSVNLGLKSLQALTVWGEEKRLILPSPPGQYIFEQPDSGDLELFHPQSGPFRLEGLDQWPLEDLAPVKNMSWQMKHLSLPVPLSLEPWFKALILSQIMLSLLLWHLKRPSTKT